MKRKILFGAMAVAMMASAICTYGDIARPKVSPTPAKAGKIVFHTGLTIVPDANAYEARLQISQEGLQNLREALAGGTVSESMGRRIAQSSMSTIMAGLFLFLSLSFAGVWLARSNHRRSQKAIAAVLIVVAMISAATIVTRANAGPPGYVRWQGLPKALTEGRATQGGLDIEIVPEGYGMKLIVPLKNKGSNGEE
jgi:hypothetical protein